MKELLEYILQGITGSDEINVEETENDSAVTFTIKSPKEYIGLIIGKEGKTIKSIRNILRIKATLEEKLVDLDVQEV